MGNNSTADAPNLSGNPLPQETVQLLEGKCEERKKRLVWLIAVSRYTFFFCLVIGIVGFSIALAFLLVAIVEDHSRRFTEHPFQYSFWAALFLSFLAASPIFGNWYGSLREDLQNVEFEEDLLQYAPIPREQRAEKLLRICQFQLRRFYDLNLGQNRWAFLIGALCITAGMAIIAYTLYMVKTTEDERSKIVLGLVGGTGGILTNFVGAIFLKVYSEVNVNLRDFHGKLIDNHDLFVAYLLVSRIRNDDLRDKTIESLSLQITGRKGPQALKTDAPSTPSS